MDGEPGLISPPCCVPNSQQSHERTQLAADWRPLPRYRPSNMFLRATSLRRSSEEGMPNPAARGARDVDRTDTSTDCHGKKQSARHRTHQLLFLARPSHVVVLDHGMPNQRCPRSDSAKSSPEPLQGTGAPPGPPGRDVKLQQSSRTCASGGTESLPARQECGPRSARRLFGARGKNCLQGLPDSTPGLAAHAAGFGPPQLWHQRPWASLAAPPSSPIGGGPRGTAGRPK